MCAFIESEKQIQTAFSFTWFDRHASLTCGSGGKWFFLSGSHLDTLFSLLQPVQSVTTMYDSGKVPRVLQCSYLHHEQFGLDQWFQLKKEKEKRKKAVGCFPPTEYV